MTLIRVIDFETSDDEEHDGKIIEAGWTDILYTIESGKVETFIGQSPQSVLYGLPEGEQIHPRAQQVHHIHHSTLISIPPYDADSSRWLSHNAKDDRPVDIFAAHNSKFEEGFIRPHLGISCPPFICTLKCARHIFPGAESFSLQYLYYDLHLQRHVPHILAPNLPAHRAGPDAFITALLLKDILLFSGQTPESLISFTLAPTHYPTCPIGKHKGKRWSEVPTSYLTWMKNAPDMEPDIKAAAITELNSRTYPRW